MADKSQEVVDGYIGMDDMVKVYDVIYRGLKALGFTEDKAKAYAAYCQAVYKELKDQHDVMDGLNKVVSANKLLPEAIAMNLVRSTEALKNYRLSAGVSVAGPFLDRFVAIAKMSGVELNECSLSVTKVAIDIGGAGTGAVSSVGLVGIPLLFLSVAATFNDSRSLGKACFQ